MRKILLLLVLYSFSFSFGFAQQSQVDSLKAVLKTEKEDTSKINTLNELCSTLSNMGDYSRAYLLEENVLQLAKQLDYKKGLCKTYEIRGLAYYAQSKYTEALKNYMEGLKVAGELQERAKNNNNTTDLLDSKQAIGAAYTDIGNIYDDEGNHPEALKYELQALKIDQEIGNKFGIGAAYNNIGGIYDIEGDYTEALKNYSLSLKIEQEIGNKQGIDAGYGNIGTIYARQGKYAEAIKNQLQALKISEEEGDKSGMDNHYFNIGNTYEKEGSYTEALENYLKSIEIAKKIDEKYMIATNYWHIGRINIMEKRNDEARQYLDSALFLCKNIGAKEIIRNVYNVMKMLDSAKENYKSAFCNYKIYIAYGDSLVNEENTKRILSEQMAYDFDRKTDSIKTEHAKLDIKRVAEIKRKNIINYSILVILGLTIIIAFLFIRSLQIKRKKDEVTVALSEKEKTLLKLEKDYLGEKLQSANNTLEVYTQSMAEKNELLEQFKTDVEKLKNLKSRELSEVRVEQLEYLSKTTILTEEDWNNFRNYFEQVYKGFFIRLKEKLPDLTPAEIRLVCLTKLKLDGKQMANILGVSSDTIRITRYRLRKKLSLSESKSIDDIAESI